MANAAGLFAQAYMQQHSAWLAAWVHTCSSADGSEVTMVGIIAKVATHPPRQLGFEPAPAQACQRSAASNEAQANRMSLGAPSLTFSRSLSLFLSMQSSSHA